MTCADCGHAYPTHWIGCKSEAPAIERRHTARLDQFDKQIATINQIRGEVYGHPTHNFETIQALKVVVAKCEHPAAREALEAICVKMARLIRTPDHLDSWIDIAGYARTGVMVTDK